MGNTWKLCNLSFITLTHTIKKRAFKLSLVALNHANRIEVFYDHISVLKEAWTILSWIWNWLPIIYLPLFQALDFPFLNPRVWASFKDTLREEICTYNDIEPSNHVHMDKTCHHVRTNLLNPQWDKLFFKGAFIFLYTHLLMFLQVKKFRKYKSWDPQSPTLYY